MNDRVEPVRTEGEAYAAEMVDAALVARRLGVEPDALQSAFGTEAAELAALARRMVGSQAGLPVPDPEFAAALEQRIRAEHSQRRRPSGVGIVPDLFAMGWRSVVAAGAAIVMALAVCLASPGSGDRNDRAPTAWAATSTATASTPVADATARAPADWGVTRPSAVAGIGGSPVWPAPIATADG